MGTLRDKSLTYYQVGVGEVVHLGEGVGIFLVINCGLGGSEIKKNWSRGCHIF